MNDLKQEQLLMMESMLLPNEELILIEGNINEILDYMIDLKSHGEVSIIEQEQLSQDKFELIVSLERNPL